MTDKLKWGVQLQTFIKINDKEFCVSTADLGGNLLPSAGFETKVFHSYEHQIIFDLCDIEEFTDRYKTEPQAIIGHLNTIEKLIERIKEEEEK